MAQPRKTDPDKYRGLYQKFEVRRIDPEAQEKHKDCFHFVLDLHHDQLAIPALEAYEAAAMQHGYDKLAEDLRLQRAMLKGKVRK